MQLRLFFQILFLSLLGPETLAWVQRLGNKIENTLEDAIISNDLPNMLVKLMECHDEFDAIALVGLHCHDARIAAELGRNYCNWLNSYTKDKDINACIIRAQEARKQAIRMVEVAAECSSQNTFNPSVDANQFSASTVSLMDIIRAEGNAIALHLEAADAAPSHVDFYFQLEQSYRIFTDLAHLTATLEDCDSAHLAISNGMNECFLAIFSKSVEECRIHIQEAQKALLVLKSESIRCK